MPYNGNKSEFLVPTLRIYRAVEYQGTKGMKRQLLIVDDDNSVRILLSRILEKEGYDCSVAEDALSARERLKSSPFDLILCDIIMPGESGLDLIRFCSKQYPNMGVIMVTGVADPQSAKEVLGIGVYGYIVKPFSNDQLLIMVDNALRRCELEREQKRQSERLEFMVGERTAALQESETKFRMVIEQANDGIAIARKGRHIYVNQKFLENVRI